MTLLRTTRLELAPFSPQDVDELLPLFNDPEVGRYLLDGAVVSREWVEEEVRESRRRFAGGGAGLWTVRARHVGGGRRDVGEGEVEWTGRELLGIVGYRPFFDPPELQLLYALKPTSWGQGIASEAATAAIGHAFDALGFHEVRAATDTPNSASIRVLERLGMTLWKTEPGDPWDTLFYRIPSSSWR